MSWLPAQTVVQIAVERVLNALPEGLLIAFFAWALLRVLRRQNSGTRFAVWFVALLTVAALPVLGGFGEGQMWPVAGVSSLVSSGGSWGGMRPAITIPARYGLFVIFAWALGASVAMARLVAGLWRLRQLCLSCTPIGIGDLDPAVRDTVDAIGASVTIATSECVSVPAAIGFFKRTIVLPTWALQELRPEDLRVILLHECAHLRRWDEWTNLIQKIVRALFFFHPAVWWIENRLSMEREMACDDAVLEETANPRGYATCLVSLLEKSLAHRRADQQWSMAQAAVHRAREAALRLAQILDTNRPVATRVWKPALGVAGTFSLACLMAFPHAPQFVAMDRGAAAREPSPAYSAAVRETAIHLVPSTNGEVSVRSGLGPLNSPKKGSWGDRRSATRGNTGHHLSPSPFAARLNAVPTYERFVEANTSADQEVSPQVRTLVFIEATQYVTAEMSGWSVQVWRVTLVGPVRDGLTVPVVNKI